VSVRRPYRSDVSDARWALIEPVFTAWRARRTGPATAARVHDLREIVNAILYVNRTGIPWEYLPHDFPPYKTVYDYYAKWEADGTTQQVHDLLRDKARRLQGRRADAQSVIKSASPVAWAGAVLTVTGECQEGQVDSRWFCPGCQRSHGRSNSSALRTAIPTQTRAAQQQLRSPDLVRLRFRRRHPSPALAVPAGVERCPLRCAGGVRKVRPG